MPDTNEVIAAAEKLGKLVVDHPTLKRYAESAKAMEADPEATRLFADFQRELMSMAEAERRGTQLSPTQEQRLRTLQTALASNLKVKAFNLAQVEMTELLRKVSDAWRRPVAELQQSTRGPASAGGGAASPASRLVMPG